MIQPEKLFENHFDNKNITTRRLCDFAEDSLNRFVSQNGDMQYANVVSRLQPALTACKAELGDVDVALTRQKGMTMTVDQVVESFKKTMSELEGVIAHALGGFKMPAFLEFYPHGLNEYSKALKSQMPELINRVMEAATNNNVALGEELTEQLTGFETSWNNARTAQEQQMGMVDDNRTDRDENRLELELALTYAVHFLGMNFPGDVSRCMDFFNFSKLEKQHHHHEEAAPVQ